MCSYIHMPRDTRCVIQTKFSCDPHALHVRSCKKMKYKVRRFFKLLDEHEHEYVPFAHCEQATNRLVA
jgi:hypothetical protein